MKPRLNFYNGRRGITTQGVGVGGGEENQNPNLRNANIMVNGQGLDMMIPTILKTNKADIKAGFKI